MVVKLYEKVELTRDVPDQRVSAGARGTLVEVVRHPRGGEDGYVIELHDPPPDQKDPTVVVPASAVRTLRDDPPASDDPNPGGFELAADQTARQQRLPMPTPPPAGKPSNGNGRRRKDTARLVWNSKPKRPPSPRDIEFQTAEVVIPNPARDAAQLPLSFRDGIFGNDQVDRVQMNRLIWGDNLLAMQALLAQGYEGKIDLIYIDPPFDSKADYSHTVMVGGSEVTREPSVIERLAYRDTWEAGIDSYLDMLYPRLQLMKRLLSDRGTIYLHIGPNINHYVRALMDEVFGAEHHLNEIVWKRTNSHSSAIRYGPVHELILFYSRADEFHWDPGRMEMDPEHVARHYRHKDEDGRVYALGELTANGTRNGPSGQPWRGRDVAAMGRHWAMSPEKLDELDRVGRIYWPKNEGGFPRVKRYLEETHGKAISDVWTDIPPLNMMAAERLGYDTQKPSQLLERIITASSQPGDLVADFFCGSGTTAAVAEKLGRHWITSDLGKVGIQVTRNRLVQQDAKPFLIENIGNYQREMIYLSGGRIGEMQRILLKLYGATPHPQHRDLGTRHMNGQGVDLVHVGYPDRPTTARKVEELARLAAGLDGKGYNQLVVLAWDYEYNFDTELEARKAASNGKWPKVEVSKRMIPPDVYDYLKKAKDEAEIEKLADKIQFHEKPYLKLAKPKVGNGTKEGVEVTVGIDRYVLFDLPVPDKERDKLREAIKANFAVLIDYWAVDWDYDGATFKSQWQALRGNGKRAKVVGTTATATLPPGKRTIAVRIVDVFGNDAAAVVDVST
jgi:adenine-specific DNA-methyltransferase